MALLELIFAKVSKETAQTSKICVVSSLLGLEARSLSRYLVIAIKSWTIDVSWINYKAEGNGPA